MQAPAISPNAARWIQIWLIVLGLMVYAMILIGGATRLTDSGLSITEWEPIKGTLLPLSDIAWATEFEKYKQTTEYKLQNKGMSLSEFKFIYFWEWGHRLFGRLIGLVAVAGLGIFIARKWLTVEWTKRLVILVALGGLQGFIGWWMVASGIGETTRVDVAPYRLMTHFMLALIILAYITWSWLDLGGRRLAASVSRRTSLVVCLLALLIFFQMATGALVAGLDAGRTYTDWPLMAGEVFPKYYINDSLGLRSLFEGREATQFNHRFLAYAIWAGSLVLAFAYRRSVIATPLFWLAGLVTLQAVWGILTLMNAAPLNLALVHQGLGVIVSLAAVRLVWLTHQPK